MLWLKKLSKLKFGCLNGTICLIGVVSRSYLFDGDNDFFYFFLYIFFYTSYIVYCYNYSNLFRNIDILDEFYGVRILFIVEKLSYDNA